jgi:uncharacterized protein (DUF433 family)
MPTSGAGIASSISSTANVCGGDACIRNTRIMVWLLVLQRRRGRSDTDLQYDYPGLALADLDAAWEYYRQHPAEIEQAIWQNTVAADHPPGTPVPAWAVVSARLLGLTDDQIRESFDPPLTLSELDEAWDEYRRHPEQIDRGIAQNRLVA